MRRKDHLSTISELGRKTGYATGANLCQSHDLLVTSTSHSHQICITLHKWIFLCTQLEWISGIREAETLLRCGPLQAWWLTEWHNWTMRHATKHCRLFTMSRKSCRYVAEQRARIQGCAATLGASLFGHQIHFFLRLRQTSARLAMASNQQASCPASCILYLYACHIICLLAATPLVFGRPLMPLLLLLLLLLLSTEDINIWHLYALTSFHGTQHPWSQLVTAPR